MSYTWWQGGQISYLGTRDGRVAYRYWPEARHVSKTLLGIHGIGGNNDNYIALGEALKPDVAVYAIDLAGNGESGTPGDVTDHAVHLRNLDALTALVRARHPHAQHYLAGYSLGAAYAPAWLVERESAFSGLILFAPPYRNVFELPLPWRIAFRVLATIAPQRRIRVRPRPGAEVDPRYLFEIDHHKFIGARTLRSLRVSADMVPAGKRALPRVTIPTLIVHGDADRVAFPEGARWAYDRLGALDKTLYWVPGAQHDLFDVVSGVRSEAVSDGQRALILEAVRSWLGTH